MINRVLIRIKVVQLLYAYMLIEKHFMLESQPTPPTKEKRFAYSLYLDTLVLMARLAGDITVRGGGKPLADNRFTANLMTDDKIKSLVAKYNVAGFPFSGAIASLEEEIKNAPAYKLYIKNVGHDAAADIMLWRDLFKNIIIKNADFNAIASTRENYTVRGVERMEQLMTETFSNFASSHGHLKDALSQLRASLDKARELYFRLLLLPVELTNLREREIDEALHKYIVTESDRNPNLRFVENQLVELLRNNKELSEYVETNKLAWIPDDEATLRILLKDIKESDIYRDYMDFPVTDLRTDIEFWRNALKHIIFGNPDFLETLEDKSVFWNDDIDIIGTFTLKTLRKFEETGDKTVLLPMFKDDEDARFGAELFSAVINNKEQYRTLIDSTVDRSIWEADRLAFMDVVIVMTAIAEMLNFPKIPVTVSINEYIEIAKSYSTSKSGGFVHGLLASVIDKLKTDGTLIKE